MASAAMTETYSELQARYEDLLRSEVRGDVGRAAVAAANVLKYFAHTS